MEQWGLSMVYKGAKHLRFLSIGADLRAWAANQSTAAKIANKAGYAQTMQIKSSILQNRSAYTVAQQSASLTNQAGGNIGFTYE